MVYLLYYTQLMPVKMPLDLALNLTPVSVADGWRDRGVLALIRAMERCEHWVVDVQPAYKAHAEQLIDDVCRVLNSSDLAAITSSIGRDPSAVIDFMGHIRTGRALAMFTWLTELNPEITKLLISEARYGSDEFGSILIERITTLERQFLLSRIFSPERIALVIELIDESRLEPA